MIIPEPYSKKMIAKLMNLSERTLSRKIKPLQSELDELFPEYSKHTTTLTPRVFRYILHELGYQDDEIDEWLRYQFSKTSKTPSEIRGNFGLK